MFRSLYEYEKRNTKNFDGIREYCILEKVNEEHIRASIEKESLGNKLLKRYKRIGHLLILIAGMKQ